MPTPLLTLTDVAEQLNISAAQTYALVRSGELKALKIGGRGQWRVEPSELSDYLTRCYARVEGEKDDRTQRRDLAVLESANLFS